MGTTAANRKVTVGLIQAHHDLEGAASVEEHKAASMAKHVPLIEQAAAAGAQIVCLQELFNLPYFCAERSPKWYAAAERIPDGPTVSRARELAALLGIVLIIPLYEEEMPGIYYNTAAVIDADGTYLGKYRKSHIPVVQMGTDPSCGSDEKFYFKPGNLGYPVFKTRFATIGVYICYDRHFPEGARLLGLHGAEIVFNPSATTAGLSEYLWRLEQPAHAVANGYFVAAVNRVGWEHPWDWGEFYGQSYLVSPRGEFLTVGSRGSDEVVLADAHLDLIREARNLWPFYRDRRPETYSALSNLTP